MSASPSDSHATEAEKQKAFFRQSGWLMVANVAAGAFMWAVHFLEKKVGAAEYGVFVTYLAVVMCIPTLPLQMVMAQQTARSLATDRRRELAGVIRMVFLGTTLVWVAAAILVFFFQDAILARWAIRNPAGLWVTVVIILFSAYVPILWGILQGAQQFLWLGGSMIGNSIGRVSIAALCVLAFGGLAVGMITGVLAGVATAVAIALWDARGLCFGPAAPFDGKALLRQIIPLVLGFGAVQFFFTADTLFAKAYFDEATAGYYGSAGTLSRALMWLVTPLAVVMFPRIVHTAAKSEKTNIMGLVLVGTTILAVAGAAMLSLLGPFVVRFVFEPAVVPVASALIPWYAFAMVPLAMANVVLNDMLARSQFRVVGPVFVLAIVYALAVSRFHETPKMVLQTLGVCNTLLFLICFVFWKRGQGSGRPVSQTEPGRVVSTE
jgi:O-antigen/teichoic acid export membrane protein